LSEEILSTGPENEIRLRSTPWDEVAFGYPTREILSLLYADAQSGARLMQRLEEHNRARQVGLCFGRIHADARNHIALLQEFGYDFVEASYEIGRGLHRFEPPMDFRHDFPLRPARSEDVDQLVDIAVHDFDYGRFHEDPRLGDELNRRRQANWIRNLSASSKPIVVHESAGRVMSFMCFEYQGECSHWILGGSRREAGYLSAFLWSALLVRLRQEGIRRVTTLISAANCPVANLYARFGFRFDRLLIGLHKHYRQASS
jgi:RimJ/RimL family protein N-acetyltransferase